MTVGESTPGKFILDATTNEMEIIYEALIFFEAHRLPAADEFQSEKAHCRAMASEIDSQLILSRS